MAVDPRKSRRVLVVHGVQVGDDDDLNQDDLIERNVAERLGDTPLRFEADLYRYEDLNDEAQRKWKLLLNLLVATPIGMVAGQALDLIGDVVTARLNTSTAHAIREGLKERILALYEAGHPCYVVAHSLGSIYAFDVVNELMRSDELFDRASRRTWPVQGLVTLGSPIGLDLFRTKGRKRLANLGEGHKWFRWINYWDRMDPIVSGEIFGTKLEGYDIAEHYRTKSPRQGWVIRDRPVDTGRQWLLAHVAYWTHPIVGDGVADLVAN